jgi:hypothetical protein
MQRSSGGILEEIDLPNGGLLGRAAQGAHGIDSGTKGGKDDDASSVGNGVAQGQR